MRRKSKKRELKAAPAVEPMRLAGLGPLLPVLAVSGVLLCAVCAMEILRSRVLNTAECNPPLTVKLEYPASDAWVEQEGWLPRIASSVQLPPSRKLMDKDLLDEVVKQVRSSGWVRHVERVSRSMDGSIRICCEYRRPIAMVLTNRGKYIPIDKDGVRLPEEYDRVEPDSGWMRILGVQAEPPAEGRAYGETGRADADAVAAVRLAVLLFGQEDIAARISGIDVANFNGREDRRRTHIRLFTRDGGRIDWGSAPGTEVEEPDVTDKLRNLVLLLKRGSLQAYADLSVYRNGVVVPLGK